MARRFRMNSLTDYFEQECCYSWINGREVAGQNHLPVKMISPVTEQYWKKVFPIGSAETVQAIAVAHTAYCHWRDTPPPVRARLLRTIADLMIEHKDLLAKAITMEMGKPIRESREEILYGAGYFSWFAGEAERIYGIVIPSQFPQKKLEVVYEPVGICGLITPWNFPIAMPARKMAAALAAGCALVIKPSAETPVSLLLLAKICQLAGLPDGVVNVVLGPEQEIGNAFLDSAIIRKISFTGSTSVGMYLYRRSADTMKRLTLELGGHAPVLVFDDAAIDRAVAGILIAKFRNAGQTCIGANRILVQQGIYEPFMEAFVAAVKKLKVGDPFDEETDISRVLHVSAREKVNRHIEDALDKGAEAILMSAQPHQPKILSGITSSMKIFSEETFGPVAPITKFQSLDQAIGFANSTEYGLSAYLFSSSMQRAREAACRLEYGMIGINDGAISTPQASFGGVKHSGFGREGGPSGIYEYLSEKYISTVF